MYRGFVKVWRKIEDSAFYKDSEYVHLWIHLLIKAGYVNKQNGIKKGQIKTSIRQLSFETGINRCKIERILKCFKNETRIETRKNNQFTVIELVNHTAYNETRNEQQMRHDTTTPKKLKKI
jgi:DNA-binding transcriptional regulator YhcF (GntR family)